MTCSKRAVDLDASFALAHAQLGYASANLAVFGEQDPALIARAKRELAVAEQLDPSLAEVHVVRGLILRSQYEGFQMEEAIRELRLAQKLDATAGLGVLAHLYVHVGLEEKWVPLLERAIELDPGSEIHKGQLIAYYYVTERIDEGRAVETRFFHRGPNLFYFRGKRMLRELRPLVEECYRKAPERVGDTGANPALLLALEGKHRDAQAAVPGIMTKVRRDLAYHHVALDMARVYALGGNPLQAVKWLRTTADTGFPCYPLFLRDTLLDPIRKHPQFVQFMEEQKARHEAMAREFP